MRIANAVRILEGDVRKVSIACLWRTGLLILISLIPQMTEIYSYIYENVATDNINSLSKKMLSLSKAQY